MISLSKIHVTVKFFALLREIVGEWRVELPLPEGATVGEALKVLAERYGGRFRDYIYDGEGRVRDHLIFLINGESIRALRGFETVLREGDTLVILPPVGGG